MFQPFCSRWAKVYTALAVATLSPACMRVAPGQNRYCFWYYRKGAQKESRDPSEAYESGIKVVESFQTVEHFWRIYNHILRADQVVFVLCWGWCGSFC